MIVTILYLIIISSALIMYTLCIYNFFIFFLLSSAFRYFSAEVGQVVTMLLALGTCSQSSTGENIFLLLDKELKDSNIPWQNCLAYCSDNASVMMGGEKGVKAFIEKEVPSVITIGCPCHLIHLAAGKAAGQLSVDVEGLLIDVYYYMEKSTKLHTRFSNMSPPGSFLWEHALIGCWSRCLPCNSM